MKTIHWFSTLGVLACISGCAHAPARAVASAPEDLARIVVELPPGELTHVVILDEHRRLGTLAAGEWMSLDLEPGTHALFAYATDDTTCLGDDPKLRPCPSVGVMHARVAAGRVYHASIERFGSSRSGSVVRIELRRADPAAARATRERQAAFASLETGDRYAIRAGFERVRFDADWNPTLSSVDPVHGEAAPRDPSWTGGMFPF